MIEAPTTSWWAISLAILLSVMAQPSMADPAQEQGKGQAQAQTQSGAAEALLPDPVLDTGLLKSHRKDDDWLKHGYYVDATPGPRLDTHLLDTILEELALPEAQAELTFWEKLENWLNRYLGERTEPVLPDWLRSFRLPEDTMLWVFYVSCLLIVLLAVGIVANEVRHARGRRQRDVESAAVSDAPAASSTSDAKPDSLLELPAWLLRKLIIRLGLSLSGTRGHSLTHRELARAGEGLPDELGEPLGVLARTAERIRFGDALPDEDEIKTAVRAGTSLLDSLEGRA